MSAAEYGEGSFQQRFSISQFRWSYFCYVRLSDKVGFPWVPIGRDGGQPLNRPVQLYEMTEARSPFIK